MANHSKATVMTMNHGTAFPQLFSPVQISAIIIGITCSMLALPGLVCNILSIIIFARVGKTTLSIVLYKILALADSGVLLIMTVNWSPLAWEMLFGDWLAYLMKISPALQYLNYVEETLKDFAVWMVVLVTLERYTKIYRPSFHSKCRPRGAKYSSVILLLCLTAFNTYILITAPLNPMVEESSNSVHAGFYTTDCLVNIVLPVTSVLFMTVKIVTAIKSARLARSSGHDIYRRDTAATRTLIIIGGVFLICQIPICFHLVIETICQYTPSAESLIPYTQAAALIFQCINSTVNFFVFYFKTTKFRHTFLVLWHRNGACIKLRFRGSPPTSSSSTTPQRMRPILKRRFYHDNRRV